MTDVLDLNELIEELVFTVGGKNYAVPPMNDAKMKKVMGLSKSISSLSSKEGDDPLTEEEEEKLLDLQNTILHETVLLKEDDDQTKQLAKTEYAKWPMKLKNRVLTLIFDQIGTAPEGEQEKN